MRGKTDTPEIHCATHTDTARQRWAVGLAGRGAHRHNFAPRTKRKGTPHRLHHRHPAGWILHTHLHTYPIGPRTHTSTDSISLPGSPQPPTLHTQQTIMHPLPPKLHRTRVPTATAATTPHSTPHFPPPHRRGPSHSHRGSIQPLAAVHTPCRPPTSRPRALPLGPPPSDQVPAAGTGRPARPVRPGPPPLPRVPSLRPARSLAPSRFGKAAAGRAGAGGGGAGRGG